MHIVIIGFGISGVSVAKTLREQSNADITIVTSESRSFFSRPALMYVYLGKMRFQDILPMPSDYWEKNNVKVVLSVVEAIDSDKQQVMLDNGSILSYDKLVIATGSVPRSLGLNEYNLGGVQGFYSLQDLLLLQKSTKNIRHAAIIGGGLIGVELAEMFLSTGISFTFWIREKWFGSNFLPEEEAQLVTNYLKSKTIDIRFEREITHLEVNELGQVTSLHSQAGEKVDTDYVCVCIGVKPNIDCLENTNIHTNHGVLVNACLQTNIPSIYAVGDCVEYAEPSFGRKSVETLWYTGKRMGEYVGTNILLDHPQRYDQGIFFNSAKFFDLEYQIYGHVPVSTEENYRSVFWKHPQKDKSIRLVYDAVSDEFLGCCVLGIRFRQEVCEKWITEKWKITEVLPALARANFDSEFSSRFEMEILNIYNNKLI
jgi:NAD(P)H-nitrite reductase large subunit